MRMSLHGWGMTSYTCLSNFQHNVIIYTSENKIETNKLLI